MLTFRRCADRLGTGLAAYRQAKADVRAAVIGYLKDKSK